MKKFKVVLIVSVLTAFKLVGSPVEILNIDFTRDSSEWKARFPEPAWNTDSVDFFVLIKKRSAGDYHFSGAFGKFNPGLSVKAQPVCLEDTTKTRRWAFRLNNKSNSFIELPELAGVGRFTVFCKNGNAESEGIFYIQKKDSGKWVTIRTMYVPPHYGRNYEQQVEEFLNINQKVQLRIFGATKNIHVYGIRANAFDAALPAEKPLRLVLMPDAQSYSEFPELNFLYGVQTMWMANHSDSIMFVLQQGDLTQKNSDEEFKISAGAMTIMDGKKLPYTFVPGNHDMGNPTNADVRLTTIMNKYYPQSRYSRQPSFGGVFEEGKMDNSWHVFSKGDYKFLILSLEFGPRNNVLEWAKKVIERHPSHNVIINTHAYLFHDNTRAGSKPNHPGRPQAYGIAKDTGDEAVNDGQQIWDKLVKHYPNCLFVFNGHVLGSGIGHQVSLGIKGNKVYEFLANYQGGVIGTVKGGNGFLRIVDMDPENKTFTIKTYSPYTKTYKTEAGQQFLYKNVNYIKDVPQKTKK